MNTNFLDQIRGPRDAMGQVTRILQAVCEINELRAKDGGGGGVELTTNQIQNLFPRETKSEQTSATKRDLYIAANF